MRPMWFAGAAAIAAFSGAAHAQANGQGQDELVVTGKLEQEIPTQLAKQGVRVDVVTAKTILNNQYVDIAQSLQTTVPGLYVSPKNGPFDYVQVSLQGSRTSDVLWLVDGVRINNRLYAGTTPLDTLPASMVEQIEVVEGPQALFYGTQSVAGAINVVTKDFTDHPNGAVAVGGDTNDSYHADGYYRGPGLGGHFVVYGSADGSRGFQSFPTDDYQPSATQRDRAYRLFVVGGKYAYDLGDSLRFTISEQHNQGRLDYMVPELVNTAYNDRNEDILTGKIDYTPSQAFQFYLKGYYHWWRSHYTEFDNDLTTPGALDVVENNGPWGYVDRGVNAVARIQPAPIVNLYVGYDLQNYSGDDAVLVISKHSETVNAVFGEIATTPELIHNFTLAAGVRYNAPTFGQSATVGDVSARWDVTHDFHIKGMLGTAFRLPTAEELFANDPNDERGDPNIKPETSRNASISIGGLVPGIGPLNWEAIGFFRNVKNLIDYESFDPITNQDVFGNVPGTVKVRGGEFVLDGAITNDVSGSASYTYSSAKQDTGLQITRVPVSLAKAQLDYHPQDRQFGLTASMNYVGDIYDNVAGQSHVNYGNYVVFNLSARLFLDRDRHHRVDAGLNNLFDERYATALTQGISDTTGDAYPVPDLGQPRTLIVRYSYSF
jgi:outer membrane cobalamin receptor